MNRLQINSSLASSNTYRRFLRTPTIICLILFMVSWIMMSIYTYLFVDNWLLFGFLCFVCYPVLLVLVFKEAHAAMIKSRLWIWGKNKFDSWPEFSDWIGKTHHLVLDYIAGLPDDAWFPNTKHGGIDK